MNHTIEWLSPAPMWKETVSRQWSNIFRRPAILRFDNDAFMDEAAALLEKRPDDLLRYNAIRETWRNPQQVSDLEKIVENLEIQNAAPSQRGEAAPVLKLYQPAHQRFYLAAASLVCRRPGYPDRTVDITKEERVAFVIRRLREVNGALVEEAWRTKDGGQWAAVNENFEPLDENNKPADDEDFLPAFPLNFQANGKTRRLYAGYIAVNGRDTFAAQEADPLLTFPGNTTFDNRSSEVNERFFNPWQNLIDQRPRITDQEQQEISFVLLVDLAEYIITFFPQLWAFLNSAATPPSGDPLENLYNFLTSEPAATSNKFADIMLEAYSIWDNFIRDSEAGVPDPELNVEDFLFNLSQTTYSDQKDDLESKFNGAISATPNPYHSAQPVPEEVKRLPRVSPQSDQLYCIRFVYEKTLCVANDPLAPGEIRVEKRLFKHKKVRIYNTRHSEPFQLASFFDPDAPQRPIRIVLPADTSPAGLKKYGRNVAVLISDQLKQQVERIQGAKFEDLDNGDIKASGGLNLGMICSLSIPIITICAMILLMIIVSLLNIVFWWLPFFKICFPLNFKK